MIFMENKDRKFDLEERLIAFAAEIINFSNSVEDTKAGHHLSGQLIRSGTSPALNYGEVQAAESRKDFIHKMKIILKELRETLICLKILKRCNLSAEVSNPKLELLLNETNELISIFVKSIQTAQSNTIQK